MATVEIVTDRDLSPVKDAISNLEKRLSVVEAVRQSEKVAYSRTQAAELTSISLAELDKQIRYGKLAARKLGFRVLIPRESLVADLLALGTPLNDEIRIRLLSLLNLARVNEARVTGIAQCQRIMIRFWRRMTVGRGELKEMREWDQLYSETLKAAEQMVSDVRLVSVKRTKEHQPTRRTR